jgi:hypothetical protein
LAGGRFVAVLPAAFLGVHPPSPIASSSVISRHHFAMSVSASRCLAVGLASVAARLLS